RSCTTGALSSRGRRQRSGPIRWCTSSTSEAITTMSDILEIEGLHAFYGPSHVLQGVDFSIGDKSVSIIGRNGMGKTTMCHSIMGMHANATGSVRFGGLELLGKPSYKIAQAGLALVPQGRRLFASLTVDEHLLMLRTTSNGQWTPRRVYEVFPLLAERKKISGARLSGGEQQMLAIGRALLLNPKLLIMDEPSEGLAPRIVEELMETIRRLSEEGMRIMLVEQNLGVATVVSERQLVMLAGRIAADV